MAKRDYQDGPLGVLTPKPQTPLGRRLGFLARGFAVLAGIVVVGGSVSFTILSLLPRHIAVGVVGLAVITLSLAGAVWLFDRACSDWVSDG